MLSGSASLRRILQRNSFHISRWMFQASVSKSCSNWFICLHCHEAKFLGSRVSFNAAFCTHNVGWFYVKIFREQTVRKAERRKGQQIVSTFQVNKHKKSPFYLHGFYEKKARKTRRKKYAEQFFVEQKVSAKARLCAFRWTHANGKRNKQNVELKEPE